MLKRILPLLIISTVIFACNENSRKVDVKSVNKSGLADEVQTEKVEKIDTLLFGNLDVKNLPKEIKFEGKINNSSTWKDKEGEHISFTTETGQYISKKFKHEEYNEGSDAEVFGYHFIKVKTDKEYKLVWKINDYILDCNVDIEASFIKNTFQITDLDQNGIAEIWMMYKTVCHGDVSPFTMKVIMHDGAVKYSMRGTNKVQPAENEFIGGEYTFDKNFKNGPDLFLKFAQDLWNKNILQNWEED